MLNFITIFVVVLGFTSPPSQKLVEERNPAFPDSLIQSAQIHLVDHVGRAFFDDHFTLIETKSSPYIEGCKGLYITRWNIDFQEHGNMFYEVGFDACGSLLGKISLPACSENPMVCQISINQAQAVEIAETALSASFVPGYFPNVSLKYERPPWDCFVWDVSGQLVSQEGTERHGDVVIATTDGAVVRIHSSETRRFTPDS